MKIYAEIFDKASVVTQKAHFSISTLNQSFFIYSHFNATNTDVELSNYALSRI